VLSTVEAKGLGLPRFLRIKKLGDGVSGVGVDVKTLFNGPGEAGEGMFFQEPQHGDEFAITPAALFDFQAATQRTKAFWKVPVLQGPGVIQGAGFAFQERQVMDGIEGHVFFDPKPRVLRNDFIAFADADAVHVAFDHYGPVGVLHGHGVVVSIEADQR
jgi:hypothetical protein